MDLLSVMDMVRELESVAELLSVTDWLSEKLDVRVADLLKDFSSESE